MAASVVITGFWDT